MMRMSFTSCSAPPRTFRSPRPQFRGDIAKFPARAPDTAERLCGRFEESSFLISSKLYRRRPREVHSGLAPRKRLQVQQTLKRRARTYRALAGEKLLIYYPHTCGSKRNFALGFTWTWKSARLRPPDETIFAHLRVRARVCLHSRRT